jgi:predicted N-formylglutamate amidohydrolase
MALLKREAGFVIGDNEPYNVTDASDYTRGLHHVAIEIRQDLIDNDEGQKAWAARLTRLLPQAYQEVTAGVPPCEFTV